MFGDLVDKEEKSRPSSVAETCGSYHREACEGGRLEIPCRPRHPSSFSNAQSEHHLSSTRFENLLFVRRLGRRLKDMVKFANVVELSV